MSESDGKMAENETPPLQLLCCLKVVWLAAEVKPWQGEEIQDSAQNLS